MINRACYDQLELGSQFVDPLLCTALHYYLSALNRLFVCIFIDIITARLSSCSIINCFGIPIYNIVTYKGVSTNYPMYLAVSILDINRLATWGHTLDVTVRSQLNWHDHSNYQPSFTWVSRTLFPVLQ